MGPRLDKFMMRLRLESKERENRGKPPLSSPDVARTGDFTFSPIRPEGRVGDSGPLLLAKRKSDRGDRYLVKHAYTDCACNEFVYTKLAQAMGYRMPDAVLFQFSEGEKRTCFKTEYVIGERYLTVVDAAPTYEKIRERAKNWEHYFAFYGLYSLTGESDGMELLLAEDGLLYRVDTADAFPISNRQLDAAGIDREMGGRNPHEMLRSQLLSDDLSQALNRSWCDLHLESCLERAPDCRPAFLEPFARIQGVRAEEIDDFLNTFCYFYPDFVGEYFKRYLSALQKQCWDYYKENR